MKKWGVTESYGKPPGFKQPTIILREARVTVSNWLKTAELVTEVNGSEQEIEAQAFVIFSTKILKHVSQRSGYASPSSWEHFQTTCQIPNVECESLNMYI